MLDSGRYVLGAEVAAFEGEYAEYVGVQHCVGVGNGLDALHLALRAMGVAKGDDVLVPSNTYIATWLAVSHVGATPVPVEPDEATYNLDPDRLDAALTSRTRAVVPVHLYGQPANMAAIVDWARAHGLGVLADAAQAHGARLGSLPVGPLGDAAAWSFYPSKNLGALGDGGAVTTNDAGLADRVRLLGNYGAVRKDVNVVVGVNSRLDELQAAVLRTKLDHLDEWNARRSRIAHHYLESLGELPLIRPSAGVEVEPAWHLFVVRTPERDALRHHLASLGIQTMVHYPTPPHLQRAYAELGWREGSLPVSEALHREVLSLPMGPHLADDQIDRVIDGVRSFFEPGGG